jgi:hypothetical protein
MIIFMLIMVEPFLLHLALQRLTKAKHVPQRQDLEASRARNAIPRQIRLPWLPRHDF